MKRKLLGVLLSAVMVIGLLVPLTHTAEAQNYSVTVTKGTRKDLSVSQNANSVTITLSGLKGTAKLKGKPAWVTNCPNSISSTKITVNVSYNGTTSTRSGDIVYQDTKDNKTYTLRIKQDKYTVGTSVSSVTLLASGTDVASVTVNGNGIISYSKSASWITVTQKSSTSSGGSYTKSYTITATANSGSAREGYVEFSAGGVAKKKVTVTQRKARTDITFPYQSAITSDNWSGGNDRPGKLNSFYDRLKAGAQSRGDTTAASVLGRAKDLTYFSWNCVQKFTGYQGNWTFEKQVYYGAPYQQGRQYVGYDCTVPEMQNAAANVNSGFYSDTSAGPKYGTDCSGFASYCLGIERKDTLTIKQTFSKPGDIKEKVCSGDLLYIEYFDNKGNRTGGHVLLVASVIREGTTLKGVVVLESQNRTTASGRNIHVYYDDDATLCKLFNGASFDTCKEILQNVISQDNTGTISDFYNKYKNTHTLMRKK